MNLSYTVFYSIQFNRWSMSLQSSSEIQRALETSVDRDKQQFVRVVATEKKS